MRTRAITTALALAAVSAAACTEEQLPGCPSNTVFVGGLCRPSCGDNLECLSGEFCDRSIGACMRRTVDTPPVIDRFEITPTQIGNPGENVVIEYLVSYAEEIEILPGVRGRGAAPASGVFTVPVFDSTTFTLRAYGQGGEATAMQSVTLIGGSVSIADFRVEPAEVKRGDTVTLSWSVFNAEPGTIRITEATRARELAVMLPAMGTRTDVASTVPLEYWIEARDDKGGVARRSFRVFEKIEGDPMINSFTAAPTAIEPGDTAILEWETSNTASLLLAGGGFDLFSTSDRFEIGRGFTIVGPYEGTEYELNANGSGPSAKSTVFLDVMPPAPPVVQRFEVMPKVRGGQNNVPVNADWSITGAQQIALYINDQLYGMVGANGTHTAGGEANLHFRLEAIARGGSVSEERRTSWVLLPEDETSFDNAVDSVAREATLGEIDPIDDFPVTVPSNGVLDAFIGNREGECSEEISRAVSFELYAQDQMTRVQGGSMIGGCQRITASGLDPGQYHLRVSAQSRVEYGIFSVFNPPSCGDGEQSDQEACDDGNRSGGDGCDGLCRAEPPQTYTVQNTGGDVVMPDGAVPVVLSFAPTSGAAGASDDGVAAVKIGFNFRFFGRSYAGVFVHTNGFLAFRPEDRATAPGGILVGEERPNAIFAPFMADLRLADFSDARGEVYYWREAGPPQKLSIAFRNLTGKTHTERDRVLLDAVAVIESNGLVKIKFGELKQEGGVRNFSFVMGIEDAHGAVGYTMPDCMPACTSPNPLKDRLIVFLPNR